MADKTSPQHDPTPSSQPPKRTPRRRSNRVTLFALTGIAMIGALLIAINLLQLTGYLPSVASQQQQQQMQEQGFLLDEFGEPSLLTEEDDSKLEVASPDFTIGIPSSLPIEPGSKRQLVKPGHWLTTLTRIEASNFDFVGDYQAVFASEDGAPYRVDGTPFVLPSIRTVPLIAGRPKDIPLTLFFPADRGSDAEEGIVPRLLTSLTAESSSIPQAVKATRLIEMLPHQYLFVVLAREQSRYTFLRTLDVVKPPYDGLRDGDDSEDILHYHVLQPDCEKSISLPENPLTWSSIAYILWDEVNPQVFTPAQQNALIDWIHWGGNLIVSGPDSLDTLNTSFLAEYLPATSAGTTTITGDGESSATLNKFWTRQPDQGIDRQRSLKISQPWSAIKLKTKRSPETRLDKSQLFAEQRVGRGRIIVSAMQLSERDLINWQGGYANLINGLLMRRLPRIHLPGQFGDMTTTWAKQDLRQHRYNSALTTPFFVIARDAGVPTNYVPPSRDVDLSNLFTSPTLGRPQQAPLQTPPSAAPAPLQPGDTHSRTGRGGWNSESPIASVAREILREEAGIEVPSTAFVLVSVFAYMLVLIPLNWLFFRGLGRVEYAWAAAPVIAIVASLLVVQQAQLDIGFARAQTEVALLELQPRHSRGHLSRFTALYTSLASSYELQLENTSSLALPLPHGSKITSPRKLTLDTREDVALSGLQIASATTEFIHSEQMWDTQQAIQLGTSSMGHPQLENRSKLNLSAAYVIYRALPDEDLPDGSNCKGCWLGDLAAGESRAVSLEPMLAPEKELFFPKKRATDLLGNDSSSPAIDLAPLEQLASKLDEIMPGETRLIARIDEILPGTSVRPAASQQRGSTLVLVHLGYPTLPTPTSDWNSPLDIARNKLPVAP